jgi:hypothetical protein
MHQIEDFLLLDIESKSAHSYFKLMVVNGASFISIKEIKSFLDFLFLFFSEFSSSSVFGLAGNDLSAIVWLLLMCSKIIRLFVHFSFFNSLNFNFKEKKLNKKRLN